MSELAIIEKIRRLSERGTRITLGIGDDCAVYRPRPNEELLFTADQSIEGVHFLPDQSPSIIGHNALARSLSDIAAMGGDSRFCLVSLAVPPERGDKFITAFYRGLMALARRTKTALAGGDLAHSDKVYCDVIVCGSTARGQALLRSGARPCDLLYVSGRLGKPWGRRFQPRLALGQALRGRATSCMDLSDGLSLDLHRLCLASGVAAVVDRIPIMRGATLDRALHGGEDYELLFTLPPRKSPPRGTTLIGSIVEGRPGAVEFQGEPLPPAASITSYHERNETTGNAMRQPVHVVYGGAHLFKSDTARKLGTLAERALSEYAPDAAMFAQALGLRDNLAATVYQRVVEKLRREPVEDYRIDFEDGFGTRSDAEEDAAVDAAAAQLSMGLQDSTLPPFIGLRIKSFAPESKPRALRTLNRFLKAAGKLPEEFVVTLPKITALEQVSEFMEALAPYPDIGVELMIETSLSLTKLTELVELTEGRCVGAHLGPYDYTASLGITSHSQHLLHPACHFARSMMLMTLAGSGIALSDGPTNILPIPPHRGDTLGKAQRAENRTVVHGAWKLHYQHVRDALYNGFYQGWDLHPAQLPTRYAAVYSFFLEGLDLASERLRNFIRMAMQATMVGDVFDDAATGQGLRNYFLRAVSCGAVPESDIPALTGLTIEQLRKPSFAAILKAL